MNLKEKFIHKFERNKEYISTLLIKYKKFLDQSNHWYSAAFMDASLRHKDFYSKLLITSEQEYSKEQYEAIKALEFSNADLLKYINNLNEQYYYLSLINNEIEKRQTQ